MANITIDDNLTRQVEPIFSELGISLSTATTIFLKQVVRHNGIPFDVSLNTPNAETLAAIDDVNHERNLSKTFHSVSELMEDLNA